VSYDIERLNKGLPVSLHGGKATSTRPETEREADSSIKGQQCLPINRTK
jgi:hypothetical protein